MYLTNVRDSPHFRRGKWVPFFSGDRWKIYGLIFVRCKTILEKNPRKEITCQRFRRREGAGDTETTTKFAVWNWRNNEDIIVVIRTSEIHFRCSWIIYFSEFAKYMCLPWSSTFFNSVAQKLNVVSSSSYFSNLLTYPTSTIILSMIK